MVLKIRSACSTNGAGVKKDLCPGKTLIMIMSEHAFEPKLQQSSIL